MTIPHQWHSLEEGADYLGIKRRTLRGYISEGKYGLVGVRAVKSTAPQGGGHPPYIGVRWDTVVAFAVKRSEVLSTRGAKGGRPCSRAGQGKCPRCQVISVGGELCGMCRELAGKPYYYRRMDVSVQSCTNGRYGGNIYEY